MESSSATSAEREKVPILSKQNIENDMALPQKNEKKSLRMMERISGDNECFIDVGLEAV